MILSKLPVLQKQENITVMINKTENLLSKC